MNLSKKWSTAAAGLLTLALVGGGAGVANAAPGDILNPQSNGSKGSFYLFDGNTAELLPESEVATRTFSSDEPIIIGPDPSDPFIGLNPAATRPVTGEQPYTQVWKFISDKNAVARDGGLNTWKAYAVDADAGSDGGVAGASVDLDAFTTGGPALQATGGSFWYGIAWTTNSGVTTVGAVYREINITPTAPGATGATYTVGAPIEFEAGEVETAPVVTTQPASTSAVEGADATFTAAASGTPTPTVQWQSSTNGTDWTAVAGATSDSLTVSGATLAQTGTQYHAVYTNSEGSATSNPATLTVTVAPPVLPGAPATQVTVPAPVAGDSSVKFAVAGATAGQTLEAWVQYNPTVQLANVTVDADGNVTIPFGSVPAGTVANFGVTAPGSSVVLAWAQVTIPAALNVSNTDLTVDVLTSNKFALEGVNAAVNLGDVKRGATTTAVPLNEFTVTDDRATLPGWNLVAAVADFVNDGVANPANLGDVIEKKALGLAPKPVGTLLEGVTLGAAQPAGSAIYGTTIGTAPNDKVGALFADGAANSSTGEAGTKFNADLTFAAPLSAKAGTYKSTLTLTLTSK